jgi:acyl-CoA reductase-like NAD-dependent aldehyde dehydrogenase
MPDHVPERAAGPDRVSVHKTYKLYIAGKFPRSESGRSYPVHAPDGTLLAHAARASRKDVREAVLAARSAQPGWAGAAAYNRGQVLYRVAEMLEDRAAQFAHLLTVTGEADLDRADAIVAESIDRWVWYAGWADKLAQVAGAANPVAGPYFNFSVPEPVGVVGILAPQDSSLLGLSSVIARAVVSGNVVVVAGDPARPHPQVTHAEVLATSDVPSGVVNILTSTAGELAPVLAAHRGVEALDLSGAPDADLIELERAAATNIKRVIAASASHDWEAPPTPREMLALTETKTVWHPIGV